MGAVRMRVQTADKNITIVHTKVVQSKKLHVCKKYAKIKIACIYKWKQSKTVLNKYIRGFWWDDNGEWTFSVVEVVLWIMDSYFVQKVYSWNALMMDFSFHFNWWTGEVWITCGLLWCFYQLFGLSFWRHPFTAEDPLVSKWIFLQIWSDEKVPEWVKLWKPRF